MTSYAAAPNTQAVRFIYTQDIPTETVSVTCPSWALNVWQSEHDNIEHAQARFSGQGPELKLLDTSAELSEYVVDFADGKVVRYCHQDRATALLENLEQQTKLHSEQIETLKNEISDMKEDRRRRQNAMIYWQVASNAVEGFCETLWAELRQEDKAELKRVHIHSIQALRQFCSPHNQEDTSSNPAPRRIYDSIPRDKKEMLLELFRAKRSVMPTSTSPFTPEPLVSQFRAFIQAFLDPSKVVESELEALVTMEIWREGDPYRLFLDDVIRLRR